MIPQLVLVAENIRIQPADGSATSPLTNGHIQLQSEGAEAFYRNIRIKKLDKMPEFKFLARQHSIE